MNKKKSFIRFVIAVAAGKGGVGKSSLAVNMATAAKEGGYEVGLLDADLYGPSVGRMMPLDVPLRKEEGGDGFFPGVSRGIKVFSISHVRPEEESMSVRAPVINGLIMQCIQDIVWGELDFLFVDFPPGTGDIQLTLMQNISFGGALLVTTPQEISVADVKKAADMFHQMNVPILGVVQNMAYFAHTGTDKKHYLFGKGGGERVAEFFGIPFLGDISLDPALCASADLGEDFLETHKDSVCGQEIRETWKKLQTNIFAMESFRGRCAKQFELVWKEI